MSDNNTRAGYTMPELIISLFIIAILSGAFVSLYAIFFNATLTSNYQARLAVESQGILRSIVEELRVSSGVRADSSPDPYVVGGGSNWSTSNANLVLIIATPAVDASGNIIFNALAGQPHINEIVYYVDDSKLYKRIIADASAPGNRFVTSCPLSAATASCPADVLLSEHFEDMVFNFYDQDDALIDQTSGDITQARSIELVIDMQRQVFGQTVAYSNNIRMTLRNEPF